MIRLDMRRGLVEGPAGTVELDDVELISLYWRMLGAPKRRVAAALDIDLAELSLLAERVSQKLGVSLDGAEALEFSFSSGDHPRPSRAWAERTLPRMIADGLAARNPDQTAIYVAGEGGISAGDTADLLARIRAGFRAAGLDKGAWVAIDAGPRLDSYLLILAAYLHGALVVRLGETVPAQVLRHMLETAPAAMTFTRRAAILSDMPEAGRMIDLSEAEGTGFETWLSTAPDPVEQDRLPAELAPTDKASIGFTSGSTGLPKAVVLTQEAMMRDSDRSFVALGIAEGDVLCSATDLTSNAAHIFSIGMPWLSGARVVLPSEAGLTNPIAYAEDCIEAGVTCVMMVPHVLKHLLATGGVLERMRDLRMLYSSTGPLSQAVLTQLRTQTSVRLVDNLGARECGMFLLCKGEIDRIMASGGGLPCQSLVRLAGPDGRAVQDGDVGEVWVHTDTMMRGYLGVAGPEPGEDTPLWFRTGDMGRYRPGDRIEIIGRSRDIIKARDGGLIFPADIEAVMEQSVEVAEACVFRSTDAEGLETVAAAVVPAKWPATEGLARALQQSVLDALGHMMVPKVVLVLEDLPRLGRGKPDKSRMAEMAAGR